MIVPRRGRQRYSHLVSSPVWELCGRSKRDWARMNIDHVKPLKRKAGRDGSSPSTCALCLPSSGITSTHTAQFGFKHYASTCVATQNCMYGSVLILFTIPLPS